MIRHSKFAAEEVEREKGVILEELNMYLDTPRDMVDNVYEELLFGDQPLGWMVIGRPDAIRAADRATLVGYVDRWYTPSRLVAGIGGRIDIDLVPRLEELLGDLSGNGAAGPPPAVPGEAEGPRVRVRSKESDQAHLCLGAPSYRLDHPDRYVIHLLTVVLGGGMSSRLFTEVRERRGLAYYVFGTNHSYTDAGSLYAQAGVDIERIDEAVTTIAGELRRIAEEPVPPEELEKARSFAKGRFVLQLESPQGLLLFGLRREVLENRLAEPKEVLDGLDAVTGDDLQRVARDILGSDLNLAVIGPFDDAERFERLLAG
jgi:predicted Zn-dependent peptidase